MFEDGPAFPWKSTRFEDFVCPRDGNANTKPFVYYYDNRGSLKVVLPLKYALIYTTARAEL